MGTVSRVGVGEAKTDLSDLIKRVEAGEKIVITVHGRPAVELVPAVERGGDRRAAAVQAMLDNMPKPSPAGVSQSDLKRMMEEGRR